MYRYAGPPPDKPFPPRIYQTNHLLHLILTILTAGAWGIVWISVALVNSNKTADEQRRFHEQYARWHADYAQWHWTACQAGVHGHSPPPYQPVA